MTPRLLHLWELLQQYKCALPEEALSLERMRRLLVESPNGEDLGHEAVLSRRHFVPGHFTASCFVLSPDEEQVLLIFHSKLHLWLQPGGHIDPGDSNILAAAQRELAEEASLSDLVPQTDALFDATIFDIDIHPIPERKDTPRHEHFDVRFAWRSSTLDARAGSDAQALRWVPLSEVAQLATDESVLRAVNKLRRR